MNEKAKITVLLMDEHAIMREGLKALFSNQPDVQVQGEADNSQTAATFLQNTRPDIISVALNFAGTNDINTIERLREQFPDVKIIAHSMYMEKTFVSKVLKAGVMGYVHKADPFSELLNAIHWATENRIYLSSRVTTTMMNGYLQDLSKSGQSHNGCLSPKEHEVLKLLSNGKSSKDIALGLHLSVKTVDTHRRQIMSKLNIYTPAELTKYAIRCGLTSLD